MIKIATEKNLFLKRIYNLAGWHTSRRLLIFESDDWGSIAMPSRTIFGSLLKAGIKVDKDIYTRFDSLASEEDLTALFDVLNKFKDTNGRTPIFTVNTNVANPDFDKIEKNNFESYYYEPFTTTLLRYPRHQKSFELWKEGIAKGLFAPQFHGREHLNGNLWVSHLKVNPKSSIRTAFDHRLCMLPKIIANDIAHIYNSAFLPESDDDNILIRKAIAEGLDMFEQIFMYRATSFIATGYIWNREIEADLKRNGIEFLQGLYVQREPVLGSDKFKRRFNYTGKKNRHGQYFLARNAFFEPTSNPERDWVNSCLKQIGNSFRGGKPAIISSHRVNYIGHIFPANRNRNLRLLQNLLQSIIRLWPNVEFISSVELGELMKNG